MIISKAICLFGVRDFNLSASRKERSATRNNAITVNSVAKHSLVTHDTLRAPRCFLVGVN